jgi:hypothetical protein
MGAVVIAIIARKERELVELFERARATSVATARSVAALGVEDGVALRRLRERAVIREGAPGTLYLDQQSWLALGRLRHRMVFLVLMLVVAMALVAYMSIRGEASP